MDSVYSGPNPQEVSSPQETFNDPRETPVKRKVKPPQTLFDKDRAKNAVIRAYNLSKSASLLDLNRFARYYRLFRNQQTTKNYQGLANLFVPEPYKVVKKKTAKLANAIHRIEVVPNGEQFKQSAQIGTHLLNYLRDKLNWRLVERLAIQESRIIGLSWIKATWQIEKERESEPWRGFELSTHPVDSVYIDPESNLIDTFQGNLRYLVHEYECSYEQLEANPNYDLLSLEALKTETATGKSVSKYEQNPLSQARIAYYTKAKGKDYRARRYQILEYWGKYAPKEGEAEEDYLIVIVNKVHVLRMGPNPYTQILDNPIPFVPVIANMIGQELYPVGDIEPAESLFNELNDTRNQRMDTVTLNIDPPKLVLKAAQVKPEQLIAKKGWVIESAIPNGVQMLGPQMQGVAAAIEEEKNIRGDIQQVTGVIDFAPGSDIQAGIDIDTARGTIIAKNESDELLEDEMNALKASLTMLYKIVLHYAQVFLDRKFTIRIQQQGVEQFVGVDSTTVQGDLDLTIAMQTLQDQTTEQQISLLLLNQARQTPGAQVGKFFTDFLEISKDNINIQEYYQQPPPAQPEPPKVSVSLKGELTPFESDQIFKQIPGVDPKMADPLLRPEGRNLVKGNHPEDFENLEKGYNIAKQHKEMLQPPETNQNAENQTASNS